MKKSLLIMAFAATMFASCENQNEDIVKQASREGSVEVSVSVKKLDGKDILTINHKVWIQGHLDKTYVTTDTLKSLGSTKQQGEDADGNAKDLIVPKDYEIYVTIQ